MPARPSPTAITMVPKPNVMPSICGSVRRKPKFAAEAVTSTTLGPGVRVMTTANNIRGPSNSFMATNWPMPPVRLNYLACTHLMLFRSGRSGEVDRALQHRHAAAADVGVDDAARLLLGRSFEDARPTHVEALADDPREGEVRFRLEMRQQADQHDVGAAGRGILGHAVQGCEHARLDLHAVFLGMAIEMDADRAGHRHVPGQHVGPHGGLGEDGA